MSVSLLRNGKFSSFFFSVSFSSILLRVQYYELPSNFIKSCVCIPIYLPFFLKSLLWVLYHAVCHYPCLWSPLLKSCCILLGAQCSLSLPCSGISKLIFSHVVVILHFDDERWCVLINIYVFQWINWFQSLYFDGIYLEVGEILQCTLAILSNYKPSPLFFSCLVLIFSKYIQYVVSYSSPFPRGNFLNPLKW